MSEFDAATDAALPAATAPACSPTEPSGGPDAGPVVAVMQPYVFPYLGYLSLVHASDVFVFYDDVQHMPRGWIHRNRILINGAPYTFTVPLAGARQQMRIDELCTHEFGSFRQRFLRQLEVAYRRAPQFDATYAWVRQVLDVDRPGMAELAMRSVQMVCERLGLGRRFLRSSQRCAASRGLPRAERLIAITRALGASRYVNAPGGASLYQPAAFAARGVSLRFVQPALPAYAQTGTSGFVPGLSVIDALMHCPPDHVAAMVRDYTTS